MINWKNNLPYIKPKYLAIEQMIINLIKKDMLTTETKLPSERDLANELDVDRSTVSRAFDELVANDIIVRKVGSGSYVNANPVEAINSMRVNWHAYLEEQRFQSKVTFRNKLQFMIERADDDLLDVYTSDLPEDLMPQFHFPSLTWQNFVDARLLETPNGYESLLKAIQQLYLHNTNLQISTDETLITGGVKQALFLILQGLLVPGDSIIIESPSFFQASSLFKATGINMYSASMNDEGIDIDELELLIRQHRAKLVILNPNFQNPTGLMMSLARRHEVIELCRKYSVPIVEDDVFGWLAFDDNLLPTLKEIDPDNVIYISSLSKILGESTRVGWLVASPQIITHLQHVRDELDMRESILPQVMASLAIQNEDFQNQLVNLRKTLQMRAEAAYAALKKAFPEWQMTLPRGGYYLWLTNIQIDNLSAKLLQQQLAIAPNVLFGSKEPALRINFARLDANQLQELIKRLIIIAK